MTTKDFEKIWRWLDAERRLLGEDGWGTMSNQEGVAYVTKWCSLAGPEQLLVIAEATAGTAGQDERERLTGDSRTIDQTHPAAE